MTFDKIYSDCNQVILSANPNTNDITFKTAKNRLLSVCTFFPKSCANDCVVGYNIGNFQWLESSG